MDKFLDKFRLKYPAALNDHIGYMILSIPGFEPSPHFKPEDQMDRDRSYTVLRDGLSLVKRRIKDPGRFAEIQQLVDDSYNTLLTGDDRMASYLLQKLKWIIFPKQSFWKGPDFPPPPEPKHGTISS